MIVVFDTNIFVSVFGFPGGRASAALDRVIDGHDRLVLSRPILTELASVMSTKLRRDKEEISRALVFLHRLGRPVEPDVTLHVLDDEPDNRILECAVAAGADAIVTGDKAMLALKNYGGVRILSLAQYLAKD